ncbi:MAG TPA: phosphoglycerate mutase family protein [Cyclobacteriaceae bacterium]|nr:phosphoglycerate mutase family protein [Cyclobacteriaceae bacterium]
MKKLLIVFLVVVCASASAQTTFILVRHAEKENTPGDKDPMLTKEGQARAQSLVHLLDKQKIDAIYSTNFNRTKNTVQPLADTKGVTIQTYQSLNLEELLAKHNGKTVVICGHSNTIPQFANALLGGKSFENFDDSDYGNLIIITVAHGEKALTHLRY